MNADTQAWSKGPWGHTAPNLTDGLIGINGADGESVAVICNHRPLWKSDFANADLIAAAPAMYGALEGLLRAVDDGEAMDRVPFDDARAALKQARGESP